MPKRELFANTGLWLTCGGLGILAAHHLLAVFQRNGSRVTLQVATVGRFE